MLSLLEDGSTRAEELLFIFSKVRERLHKEGGITSLSLDFPIRELNHDHFMGMTYTAHGNWKEVGNKRVARENVVQSVGIRLRYQNSNRCYDLQTLLATLLHEFAHSITPGEMLYGHTEEGRRCRGWHDVAHTDEFYANYALILEKAEALDIFSLPGDPRWKFTKMNLIQFDDIDSQAKDLTGEVEGEEEDSSLPGFMCSPDGAAATSSQTQALPAEVQQEPLRLTLCHKGARKMVVLQQPSLDELAKVVRQKFRTKMRKVTDAKGAVIGADDLSRLPQDSVVNIA